MAAAIYHESGKLADVKRKGTIKNEFYPCKEGDKIAVEVNINMVKEVYSQYGSSLLIKMVTSDGYSFTTIRQGSPLALAGGRNCQNLLENDKNLV